MSRNKGHLYPDKTKEILLKIKCELKYMSAHLKCNVKETLKNRLKPLVEVFNKLGLNVCYETDTDYVCFYECYIKFSRDEEIEEYICYNHDDYGSGKLYICYDTCCRFTDLEGKWKCKEFDEEELKKRKIEHDKYENQLIFKDSLDKDKKLFVNLFYILGELGLMTKEQIESIVLE
jgi:hypothetical protein